MDAAVTAVTDHQLLLLLLLSLPPGVHCLPSLPAPPDPVLPHLRGCGAAIASIANTATQLKSLSLSRYDVGGVACVTSARQLTSLALQHCSLSDSSLRGLASLTNLQQLELSDNNLTPASLHEVARLPKLVSVRDGLLQWNANTVEVVRFWFV